jgi:hypothetical protein
MLQAGMGKKQDLISKTTSARRAGSMVQVIEWMPSKSRVFSSNLRTSKKLIQ